MARIKLSIISYVASALVILGATIIIGKSINGWLNTPLDPGWTKRRVSRELVKGQFTKIHAAMMSYASHNNSHLPPMNTTKEAQRSLDSYVSSDSIFISAVTHHPFQPNGFLSNHKLSDFVHPSQVVAFYDVHPPGQGYEKSQPVTYPQVDILFLSGDFSTVSIADWFRYRMASKIP